MVVKVWEGVSGAFGAPMMIKIDGLPAAQAAGRRKLSFTMTIVFDHGVADTSGDRKMLERGAEI